MAIAPTDFKAYLRNVKTTEVFEALILPFTKADLRTHTVKKWLFDWSKEVSRKERQVYKLVTVGNPAIVLGLLSVELLPDAVFMHLIESADFNRGKNKQYDSVPGVLIAFACWLSFNNGSDGFVFFDSKTRLIPHYQRHIRAQVLRGLRMYLDTAAANWLLAQNLKRS